MSKEEEKILLPFLLAGYVRKNENYITEGKVSAAGAEIKSNGGVNKIKEQFTFYF